MNVRLCAKYRQFLSQDVATDCDLEAHPDNAVLLAEHLQTVEDDLYALEYVALPRENEARCLRLQLPENAYRCTSPPTLMGIQDDLVLHRQTLSSCVEHGQRQEVTLLD